MRTALTLSNLATGQTLESVDVAFQPAIGRARIETLATGAWVRGKETVLLQGPPREGKTHLAVSLGVKAVQLGLSAQYDRFDGLMTALRADAGMPPARLGRRRYTSTALLIIDRFGFEAMSREEASPFFRLITDRYDRGAILITTNKIVRDWTGLLAGGKVMAGAIPDRLLHRSNVLNINGRSYRLREFEGIHKHESA